MFEEFNATWQGQMAALMAQYETLPKESYPRPPEVPKFMIEQATSFMAQQGYRKAISYASSEVLKVYDPQKLPRHFQESSMDEKGKARVPDIYFEWDGGVYMRDDEEGKDVWDDLVEAYIADDKPVVFLTRNEGLHADPVTMGHFHAIQDAKKAKAS